jgi:oligo-1,6-glucosidase
MLLPHDERLYAYTRRLGETELLVIGNFSADSVPAEIDDAAEWESAELLLTNTATPPSAGLVLGPWQAVVYRRSVSR